MIEAIIALSILLVTSNVFWAWHAHKLINKLMSRNYFEYHQVQKTDDKKNDKPQVQEAFAVDDVDLGRVMEVL